MTVDPCRRRLLGRSQPRSQRFAWRDRRAAPTAPRFLDTRARAQSHCGGHRAHGHAAQTRKRPDEPPPFDSAPERAQDPLRRLAVPPGKENHTRPCKRHRNGVCPRLRAEFRPSSHSSVPNAVYNLPTPRRSDVLDASESPGRLRRSARILVRRWHHGTLGQAQRQRTGARKRVVEAPQVRHVDVDAAIARLRRPRPASGRGCAGSRGTR